MRVTANTRREDAKVDEKAERDGGRGIKGGRCKRTSTKKWRREMMKGRCGGSTGGRWINWDYCELQQISGEHTHKGGWKDTRRMGGRKETEQENVTKVEKWDVELSGFSLQRQETFYSLAQFFVHRFCQNVTSGEIHRRRHWRCIPRVIEMQQKAEKTQFILTDNNTHCHLHEWHHDWCHDVIWESRHCEFKAWTDMKEHGHTEVSWKTQHISASSRNEIRSQGVPVVWRWRGDCECTADGSLRTYNYVTAQRDVCSMSDVSQSLRRKEGKTLRNMCWYQGVYTSIRIFNFNTCNRT